LHDNALSLTILFNITILIIATPNELHSWANVSTLQELIVRSQPFKLAVDWYNPD
jgi:hypothetical protein